MAWSRTSRHKRGYGTAWYKLRDAKLRDQPLCEYCLPEYVTAATEVDHFKPKAQGGTDDYSNLRSTCKACHRDKTARESAEAQGRTYKPKLTFGADGWPISARSK